ncbi:synergin gamma-like isoform X2 [Pseudophryne corroboree]|uniref:synergin gamma-like isoform X2 n=1 Tax=Pseudophryne corroboree TaxID=495146 RepID=UPI0030817F55
MDGCCCSELEVLRPRPAGLQEVTCSLMLLPLLLSRLHRSLSGNELWHHTWKALQSMAIEPSLVRTCTYGRGSQLQSPSTPNRACFLDFFSHEQVIQKANEILCSISQPSVCSEVLQSTRGTDYISGVVEVYRVSKRMEGGMRTHNIDCERLRLLLRDIELSWNNLQAFLSMCPSVLQKLPSLSALGCEVEETTSDSNFCLQRCCGVCLLESLEEEFASEPKSCMLNFGGLSYHPSCANFWLNCVDAHLPVLSCHSNCFSCLKLKEDAL